MSEPSQSESSSHQSATDSFAFTAPPPAVPGPETVINPQRRSGSSSLPLPSADTPSELLNRLFPPERALESGLRAKGPTGCELGHFVIEGLIGSGGMGAVFRAVDTRLERVVALKVLSPNLSRDAGTVQRFYNEARAAARLDHENIARVYYFGEDAGLFFMAHEFVTGTTLRDLIRVRGALDPAEAVNYTLQIAAALSHVAAAGVVHRDIKPSNIIVTPAGRAKLVDLGLAKKQESESVDELTLAGTTLGTFDYISPEQAKDPRKVDIRADIYSLGCTMYHMLTGAPPYPEGTVLQKLLDHQGKEPPDPTEKNPRVPPQLSAVIRKMMASDPRRRYTTPEELVRDLMPLGVSLGLRGVNPDGLIWTVPEVRRERFWERHLSWIATVAVLLLIVLALDQYPQIGQQRISETRPGAAFSEATSNGPTPSVNGFSGSQAADPDQPFPMDNPIAPSSDDEDTSPVDTAMPQDPAGNETTLMAADDSRDADEIRLDGDSIESVPAPEPVPAPRINRPVGRQPAIPSPFDAPELEIVPRPMQTDNEPTANSITATKQSVTATVPSGTTSVARAPAAAPPPIPPSPPYLIAGPDGDVTRSFRTLEAACAAAKDGDVIELRYNGARSETEKPLRVANKKIIIRAARRFRPLVRFKPSDIVAAESQTRMISAAGASIELVNVDIDLIVRDDVITDQWSLFLLEGANTVRLDGVNVNVLNPADVSAAVFELVSGPISDLSNMNMRTNTQAATQQKCKVEVINSFVKGGCDLFSAKNTQPGRFDVEESVIAVEGTFLNVIGDDDMPFDEAALEMQLEHVTCLVRNGLINMDSGVDLPRYLPQVNVSARNNVFATDRDVALISMTGNRNAGQFRDLLLWEGANNYFDRLETFWSISPSQLMVEESRFDFEDWKRIVGDAEAGTNNSGVDWLQSWRHKRFSKLTRDDLAIDPEHPAATAATDLGTVGADLSLIPAAASNQPPLVTD